MDDSVERFLSNLKPSTSRTYRTAFEKHFFPFLDQWQFDGEHFYSFKELIDVISKDQSLPVTEKRLIGRQLITDFGKYLEAKKLAPKGEINRVGAVQSCFKFWEVTLTTKYTNLPNADAQTESYDWTIPMFEKFNALLRTPRYRALDAFLFQSGLAISDVLCRKYGEIQKDFEAGITPCFKLKRGKTGVWHHTCIGPETITLLKAYFEADGTPQPDQRIFPMSRRPVDDIYADRAHKLIGSWPFNNPCSPHSRRKFFRNRMVGVGSCPSEYAEYFMGHSLSADIKKIYSTMSADGWRVIYDKYKLNLAFQILDYEKVKKELKL